MKASVVIPVYNVPEVDAAIQSVYEQKTSHKTEIVVVDGKSSGETRRVLEKCSGYIDKLIVEEDDGVFDALNKGIRKSSGDIVSFLGADDRLESPNVLDMVCSAMKGGQVDVCYGDGIYVKNGRAVRKWVGVRNPYTYLRVGWRPLHPSVFIRNDIHEKYGLFDTDFDVAADYEMWVRLFIKQRVRTRYLPVVMARMKVGGQSNSSLSNIVKGNREKMAAWSKNSLWHGLGAVPLTLCWNAVQYARCLWY